MKFYISLKTKIINLLNNGSGFIILTGEQNLFIILIQEKSQCVKKCNNDFTFKYQFNKNCFEKCPNGTKESDKKLFFCEIIYNKESHFEIISSQKCVSFCEINE